ncbi:MAG: hypothetical protein KDD61_14165 [Bdellovibrionales bacterium]|nr:hypothetical protein [Bdellovibrionales bacterium]
MAANRRKTLRNEKGLATVESLPLIVIFLVLITYGLGLFGVIHTSILGSIGARAYAFDTFKNRTNLELFRQEQGTPSSYRTFGMRYHGTTTYQNSTSPDFIAIERPIVFGRAPAWAPPGSSASVQDHNERIFQLQPGRNRQVGVSPAWIMIGYGICLDAACGEN